MKKDSLLIYVGRKIDALPLDAHEQNPVMIDRIAWGIDSEEEPVHRARQPRAHRRPRRK
jgi:hypothetical protein